MTGAASAEPVVLVDGGTFALTGADGEITGRRGSSPDGFFVRDARHLSRWRLTADGQPLTVLTADAGAAVLVVPGSRDEPSAYTVRRVRAVAAGTMVERLTLLNNLPRPVETVVELTVDADFADQFELRSDRRHYDKPGSERTAVTRPDGVLFHYRRGPDWSSSTQVITAPPPDTVDPLPPADAGEPGLLDEGRTESGTGAESRPGAVDGAGARAGRVLSTMPDDGSGSIDGSGAEYGTGAGTGAADESGTGRVLRWRVVLPAHGSAELGLAVRAFAAHAAEPAPVGGDRGIADPAVLLDRQAREAVEFTEPLPVSPDERPELARTVRQGLADLAALRVPATGPDGERLRVPGAGIPWFLTLFGRDALLTSFFCLPYRPGVAEHTLRALAAAQGTGYDPARLEQPGRIPHELRHGELAHFRQVPYGRYYGSVDATPLFLVLLQAYTEATGDRATAVRLESHARAAVEWMFRDGGLDTYGWLVYTSDERAGGLANQNWKDSAGAICRADGTQLTGAIAVAEAQGYAYDALWRTARLAVEVWDDPRYARRLTAAAKQLRHRFPAAFWLPDADFPALALDGDGRQADALGSDAGHLLWSGLLDQDQAERVARRLLRPDFFSGWGIRTLAAGQQPYHPLSYHRGAVWPHDNAVIALGMARYGLTDEASLVASSLVAAARHHAWRLPEVISGYGRDQHGSPIPYPHACSPQAWAAATPLALLTATSRSPG